nr:hypothetical protein DM860_012361 [Ipomoea trifida]
MDAFFLGKAIGEAISERVESTVGEFLSNIGRLQAEQQKIELGFAGMQNISNLKILALLSQIHQTFEHGNLVRKEHVI